MKVYIKNKLEKWGVRINLKKNLWYLDSFKVIKKICDNPKPVIFDVGACDGSSIVDFIKIFPKAKIYSFEPFPDSYNTLENFCKSFEDVKAFQIALSNRDGEMNFYVNKSNATNSLLRPKITSSFIDDHAIPKDCIKVLTMKIDSFILEHAIEHIDILKIDVQGGEKMVFEGAENTLAANKIKFIYTEIWFIEGYVEQPLYHDVATYLANFGYYSFGIYNMHYRKDGHFLWGDAIFYLK